MATQKITFQDILNKSNPSFKKPINYVGFKKDEYANAVYYEGTPENFKEEIENRLKKVNVSARTNPTVLHRRSKAFQSIYHFLSSLDYEEVERLKTLPKRIDACNKKKSISKRVDIIAIREDFKRYKGFLFEANLNTDSIYMGKEAETVIKDYTYHTYKDLL